MDTKQYNSEQVYDIIKGEILSLDLMPGQRLFENELCNRFSLSRTPIRSILQRLKGEGLISGIPYKETRVATLNYEAIKQMVYLRVAVESQVLEDFINSYTPLLLEKVRYHIRKQEIMLDEGYDLTLLLETDSRFHGIIYELLGKNMLWNMIENSQVDYQRFRRLDLKGMPDYSEIIEQHKMLFEMLEYKDVENAKKMIKSHLYSPLERTKDKIQNEYDGVFSQN